MKKIPLAAIALLSTFSISVKAQTWFGSTPGNIYYNSGNVGIGTTSPLAKLDVKGPAGITSFTGTPRLGLTIHSAGTNDYTGIDFSAPWGGTDNPLARIASFEDNTGTFLKFGTSNDYNSGITNTAMTIDPSGRIGIGTTTPAYRLVVNDTNNDGNGYLGFSYSSTNAFKIGRNNTTGNLDFTSLSGTNNYGYNFINGNVGIGTTSPTAKLDVANNLSVGAQGGADITSITGGAGFGSVIKLYYADGVDNIKLAGNNDSYLNANHGNVGIGTKSPDEKLTVYGKIHSQEVKVDLSVPGPDYVFEPTYKLLSLAEIKTFVDKNHHLPEIPTAAEMAKNGIDLGDMNTKLLKKVEELTLYLIEQDKAKQDQQKQIDLLNKKLEMMIAEKKEK